MAANILQFEEALPLVTQELQMGFELKMEQKEALKKISEGQNVFAILPTGYGKSLVYGLAPVLLNKMNPSIQHICIVISPLRALMKDQVKRWNNMKISACAILRSEEMESTTIESISSGQYSLIFLSPEAAEVPKWREVLKKMRQHICLLAFDEVHCIIEWGETFRPVYKHVGSLRSILHSTPILATTATANEAVKHHVIKTLCMEMTDFHHIAAVSNRPNIFLKVDADKDITIEDKFQWYGDLLQENKGQTPKCIIYCRSLQHMMDIYGYFESKLGEHLFVGESGRPGQCLVEMFYADVDAETQEVLPKVFMEKESSTRCVVATIAFGMGIDIPDIEYIIHWGPPKSFLAYWQEVGRGGRDGRKCTAILLMPPHSLHSRRVDSDLLDTLKKCDSCFRKKILMSLMVEGLTESDVDQCCGGEICCSVCAK